MSRFWKSLLVLLLVVLLVAGVRLGVVTLLTIPDQGEAPALLAGDRVTVNRWAYGYRLPFGRQFGYRRWKVRTCQRNEWAVFNAPASSPQQLPDTSRYCVGRCMALPGDTVWMGAHGHVSPIRTYSSGQVWPLVVPGRGTHVHITPWNAPLYALTINRHEQGQATVEGDSLYIDGKSVSYYRFQHDYYWMTSGTQDNLNDSRRLGFIPHEALLGRVENVAFSFDGWKPRWNRIFLPL